jgi:hypothetical protein
MLPEGLDGLSLVHSQPARTQLLDDLRADDGMSWVPQSGWLSQLRIDSSVADLRYDLAIDASGLGQPSRVAAGLPEVEAGFGPFAWFAGLLRR